MDENRENTITVFDAESTTPASWNGGRPNAEQRPPSAMPLRGARGRAVAQESRTGGDGMSRLLRVEDVASLLNVPRKWVYRRVGLKAPDGIPHLKIGKYLRFRESDVQEYVDSLRRN